MSQTITHIIGFLAGITAAELTIAHAGPMAFFSIPFTKRLMKDDLVDGGRDILKAYRGVVLVLGVVYLVSFAAAVAFLPRILPGFVVGSLVLIAVRFRGWGYTLRNFDEYMKLHASRIKEEDEGSGNGIKKRIAPPK